MHVTAEFTQAGEEADPDHKKALVEEELLSPAEKKKRVPNMSKVSTLLYS